VTARIVLDARLLHYNRTGIGRYLRHLYTAMAPLVRQDGPAEVQVAYHRKDRERALSGSLVSHATLLTPAHHRLERWTLAAELLRLKPALVHAPDHVCAQPLGWKTVLTVHDLAFWRVPASHSAASRAYYDGLRRSVEQASRVICVSDATRRDLLEYGVATEQRLRVVHEAPDPLFASLASGHETDAAEVTQGGGRPYFVCVGTIEPRKNHARIIRAFAALHSRWPHDGTELLIVGNDGVGAPDVRALPVQLGIADSVRFLGPLPATEIARLYQGAVGLVYPSLLEGFGLPILEAMASGCAVITSNRSAMAEVAGDAALLVDPDNEESIMESLRRLMHDEGERQRLVAAGRQRMGKFSWERAARETFTIFQEALSA